MLELSDTSGELKIDRGIGRRHLQRETSPDYAGMIGTVMLIVVFTLLAKAHD